jgi:putative oxidoreductase
VKELIRFLARGGLAAIFVRSGLRALRNPTWQVERVKQELPALPEPELVARTQAVVHVVGGIALAVGVYKHQAAAALAATLVPITYVGHPFWKMEDQAQRNQQVTHLLKNLGMAGGLVLFATEPDSSKR